MNAITWKLISFLLALCMLVSLAGCNESSEEQVEPAPSNDEQTPNEPEQPEEVSSITLNDSYVLVRPDLQTQEEVDAMLLLGRGLESAYGTRFPVGTDYIPRGEEGGINEFEILIGETNREASQLAMGELSMRDWMYRVVSPNVVVICGGSPEATFRATVAFLSDVLGYTEDESGAATSAGNAVELEVGLEYIYRYEYEVKTFLLGEHNLSEYTLVTTNAYKRYTEQIVTHFVNLTGVELPVVMTNQYEGGPAIFLGCLGADGSHLDLEVYGRYRYYMMEKDGNIAIDFIHQNAAVGAVERFLQECTPAEMKTEVSVSFAGDRSITGVYVAEGTNSLVFDRTEAEQVAPGVTYEDRLYHDANGNPVHAYVLTIAPGAATLETCTPGDLVSSGEYATVPDQLAAAQGNGKVVLGGVNADFFANGLPLGLFVKDGTELHGASERPWVGVTKDGELVIATGMTYNRKYVDELTMAVGGSNIILEQDEPSDVAVFSEFGDTRHPRTAIGIKPDGTVVLMVVDGRQPSHSNGASLADLAELFASLGCCKAINLDGGGSSTMVVAGADGALEVKNNPSDGSPRSVVNGIMVVLP